MINQSLLQPKNILVVGGSEDTAKPGGKLLKNIITGNFSGDLFVLNPKADTVQGVRSFREPSELPDIDLAILAIAAIHCPPTLEFLASNKSTRAFIVISAGFAEEGEAGAALEREMVEIAGKYDACLMGPNCIGFLNPVYQGVFTTPVPKLDPHGCDLISGSGATAVFIMEAAIPKGLRFASVYSVGNSAQVGVEDVLKYMDENFNPQESSRVKLLYLESITKPDLLLKHASSLIRKGCRIAAVKAGSSEAGSRAASSHTGALASSDMAVAALLRKAGIVRCESREELTTIAAVFMHKPLTGKNIAIITHAGGPAVMLTDVLSHQGLEVPSIEGATASALLEKLYPGSSVSNPIDFLATGNAEQLDAILEACEFDFDDIDGMVVIFGSPGLFPVDEVYDVIDRRMKSCQKPIYPVLPSVINASSEVNRFLEKGRINFPDEVTFGRALARSYYTHTPSFTDGFEARVDTGEIRAVMDSVDNGYLAQSEVLRLLRACGIIYPKQAEAKDTRTMDKVLNGFSYPVVMKVTGPLHKSDVGGVILDIKDRDGAIKSFEALMKIEGADGVLVQSMHSGIELFAGAKREENFGHMIMCGLGGIFIEVLKDVQAGLAPLDDSEALGMIENLRGFKMIKGVRGMRGVDPGIYADILVRISHLVSTAPEIFEMDLNPMLGERESIIAVDARIRIEK